MMRSKHGNHLTTISLALCIVGTLGDWHVSDDRFNSSGYKFFDKTLFDKEAAVPTNYTIYFKYQASGYSGRFEHCAINVTANSSATINIENGAPYFLNTVEAVIHAYNATKLSIHASIYGIGTPWALAYYNLSHSFLPPERRPSISEPFGVSIIHEHREINTNRMVTFGRRQSDDQIIYFEKKSGLMTEKRFAEVDFNYNNQTMLMTCVETSFSSPSIVTFADLHNEQNLVVHAYDLHRIKFNANLTIFGYERANKPADYEMFQINTNAIDNE